MMTSLGIDIGLVGKTICFVAFQLELGPNTPNKTTIYKKSHISIMNRRCMKRDTGTTDPCPFLVFPWASVAVTRFQIIPIHISSTRTGR